VEYDRHVQKRFLGAKMKLLERFEEWYATQCDGDWEHSHGIRISTMDNPGWHVTIELSDTPLQDVPFEALSVERSDSDWFECRVVGTLFDGVGGPKNLGHILHTFLTWRSATENRVEGS
jgi:hypothetical protein